MPQLFDLNQLSSDELIAVIKKFTPTTLVGLRQTCRLMDAFVVEKRAHIGVAYKPIVNICFSSNGVDQKEERTKIDEFSLAFAGLCIENVACAGACNTLCCRSLLYQHYINALREIKWNCKMMLISQVRESIIEIIKPDLLVIEDYSRGDSFSRLVHNLELTWFTGPLPDLEENNFIQELTLKPATSRDFIESIQNSLSVFVVNKLGSVTRLEIIRSHMKTSLQCQSCLQEALETISDELGPAPIYNHQPSCRASELIYSKMIEIEGRRWQVTLSNEITQSECILHICIVLLA